MKPCVFFSARLSEGDLPMSYRTVLVRIFKSAIVIIIAYCTVAVPHLVHAKEKSVDKFKISLGGYTLARNESEMSLTERTFGAGVSISPEDTLGLETEQTVFRLDGRYRFNQEHAMNFSWYSISSNGTKQIEEQIDWVDENGDPITIPVGARVDTQMDLDVYKMSYLWSFYHSDKVELGAGIGLHVTRIAIGLKAETSVSEISAKDVALTVPLPVLSFGLNYHVSDKFSWYLKSESFSIEFEDWSGSYTDNALGVEYRLMKNVGLGLGWGSNAFKVNRVTDEYRFVFANRISGISFYVVGHF
jgi:hypothetical protein